MKLHDLLDVPVATVAELALKYQVPVHEVQAELDKGIQVEQEHTSHEHVARQIALAHLAERLDYYDQLAQVDEATTRTSKSGAPGTLKAKISGPVTCDKVKALKNRARATPHDVRQANWFINMHGCSESQNLTEIFQEPAQHVRWTRGEHGTYQFFETEFQFMGRRVVVGLYEDHGQTAARFVTINRDINFPANYRGYSVVFSVNGTTDVTGELGTAASKLFAQVVSVLKGFLSTHAWDYVLFVGEPGSRDKLYDVMAHKLAGQIGAQVASYRSDFLIYKPGARLSEQGGVGLVVPGVNMPAGMHKDEIRRQARKWGFKVSKHGVPPIARTDGKI